MKRKENRALRVMSPNKENTMVITREVNKTVKDSTGKDFKRKATITFEVPEKLDDLAALVGTFGSVEKLAQAAIVGVLAVARLDATNELMKGDKASKALKKMASALKAVMPSLSDEAAIKMVLTNPEVAKAFESGPVAAEISLPVNPATQEVFNSKSGTVPFMTWLAGGEAESDEEDADEKGEETPVAA